MQQYKYEDIVCNLAQNISKLFNFLEQSLFTTSEMELDYYHQKENAGATSWVAEQLRM